MLPVERMGDGGGGGIKRKPPTAVRCRHILPPPHSNSTTTPHTLLGRRVFAVGHMKQVSFHFRHISKDLVLFLAPRRSSLMKGRHSAFNIRIILRVAQTPPRGRCGYSTLEFCREYIRPLQRNKVYIYRFFFLTHLRKRYFFNGLQGCFSVSRAWTHLSEVRPVTFQSEKAAWLRVSHSLGPVNTWLLELQSRYISTGQLHYLFDFFFFSFQWLIYLSLASSSPDTHTTHKGCQYTKDVPRPSAGALGKVQRSEWRGQRSTNRSLHQLITSLVN